MTQLKNSQCGSQAIWVPVGLDKSFGFFWGGGHGFSVLTCPWPVSAHRTAGRSCKASPVSVEALKDLPGEWLGSSTSQHAHPSCTSPPATLPCVCVCGGLCGFPAPFCQPCRTPSPKTANISCLWEPNPKMGRALNYGFFKPSLNTLCSQPPFQGLAPEGI